MEHVFDTLIFALCVVGSIPFGFLAVRMWSYAYFQSKLEYQNAFYQSLSKPNQEAPSNGSKV